MTSARAAELRARFRRLHTGPILLMPNPWDVGSAKLLVEVGAASLATTSAGHAGSQGRLDQHLDRPEVLAHVAATDAAGFSIEDYDPRSDAIRSIDDAAARVAAAKHAGGDLVLTARAENHLYGIDDLADTITRLEAYRDAGADAVYAPGLTAPDQIERVVAVGLPVNVLALPGTPPIPQLAELGVARVSVGSLFAWAAYGAMVEAAREMLGPGTSGYSARVLDSRLRDQAFG